MNKATRHRWIGALVAGAISGAGCVLLLVLGPWLLGWPGDYLGAALGCLAIAVMSGVACGVLSAQ